MGNINDNIKAIQSFNKGASDLIKKELVKVKAIRSGLEEELMKQYTDEIFDKILEISRIIKKAEKFVEK